MRVELTRLRDRQHDLEKQVWGAAGVDQELGRGLGELRDEVHQHGKRIGTLEEQVEQMTKAEEIASAVAVAIRRERRNLFTIPQRVGAGLLALLVAIPALHEVFSWFGL